MSGRFIAWARVPALRLAISKGVIGAPAPVVSAPVSVAPVSAPVSVSVSIPAPVVSVVRVVRAPTVSAFRSVVARVRSWFGRFGQALTRAGIGGDM